MDDRKWERWGALGGILFAILVSVAALLPGTPPKPNDSVGKVAKWVADNGDQIRVAGYAGALAIVPFFWWLGSLWRMLRRAEGGSPRLTVAVALGAVYTAAAAALSGIILALLPIMGAKTLGANLRTFYLLGNNIGFSALFGVAVITGGASIVFLRSRVMPALVGWLGVLVAIAALVGAAGSVSTKDLFVTVGFIAYMGATLWVLIVSILMFMRAPAVADEPATGTAPAAA